jgi:hypothetical protein
MVCSGDVKATVRELKADDSHGRVLIVDDYTFRDTGRRVRNPIECRFTFQKSLIVDHRDRCDPLAWARQAFGGVKGELLGRVRLLRKIGAGRKLKKFLAANPA